MMRVILLFVMGLLGAMPQELFAQLLPQGVGAYSLGYRQFSGDPSYFDASGGQHTVGSRFDQDFSSEEMASGGAGQDLQRLYQGLQQYDANSADAKQAGTAQQQGLADQLNLGRIRGSVKSKVQAQYLAVAYGFTSKWTGYLGVPYVSALVDTNLSYSGANNASDIQRKLGDFAYDELQTGLSRAGEVSASSVKNAIENENGYANIDRWKYQGLGDVFFGARTQYALSTSKTSQKTMLASWQLDLPTGHADDPDILTDTNIGRGYYVVSMTAIPKSSWEEGFVAAEVGGTYGFARDVKRRVPMANESLVASDRKTTVHWQPGQDAKIAGIVGFEEQVLQYHYKLGQQYHTRDQYSGTLSGNYNALEEDTASQVRYHELTLQFSSVKAFQAKKFAVPFVLSLTAHDTFAGRNTGNIRYFELSIMSFFKGGY